MKLDSDVGLLQTASQFHRESQNDWCMKSLTILSFID